VKATFARPRDPWVAIARRVANFTFVDCARQPQVNALTGRAPQQIKPSAIHEGPRFVRRSAADQFGTSTTFLVGFVASRSAGCYTLNCPVSSPGMFAACYGFAHPACALRYHPCSCRVRFLRPVRNFRTRAENRTS